MMTLPPPCPPGEKLFPPISSLRAAAPPRSRLSVFICEWPNKRGGGGGLSILHHMAAALPLTEMNEFNISPFWGTDDLLIRLSVSPLQQAFIFFSPFLLLLRLGDLEKQERIWRGFGRRFICCFFSVWRGKYMNNRYSYEAVISSCAHEKRVDVGLLVIIWSYEQICFHPQLMVRKPEMAGPEKHQTSNQTALTRICLKMYPHFAFTNRTACCCARRRQQSACGGVYYEDVQSF